MQNNLCVKASGLKRSLKREVQEHEPTFLWHYQFQYSSGRKEEDNIQTESACKTTWRWITEEQDFLKPNSVKAASFFHGLLMRVEPELYTLKTFQQFHVPQENILLYSGTKPTEEIYSENN